MMEIELSEDQKQQLALLQAHLQSARFVSDDPFYPARGKRYCGICHEPMPCHVINEARELLSTEDVVD